MMYEFMKTVKGNLFHGDLNAHYRQFPCYRADIDRPIVPILRTCCDQFLFACKGISLDRGQGSATSYLRLASPANDTLNGATTNPPLFCWRFR